MDISHRYTPRTRYSMINSDEAHSLAAFSDRGGTLDLRQSSNWSASGTGRPSIPRITASEVERTRATLNAIPTFEDDEEDDWLHDPRSDGAHHPSTLMSMRGFFNVATLGIIVAALFMLFAGWPILSWAKTHELVKAGTFNLGGVNSSGQIASVVGNFGLIDYDTPESAQIVVTQTGETWELVFSDEFNTPGRSFYPGDDPYWESQDLHAWSTNDLEYYSPAAATTVVDLDDDTNGFLRLTLSNITQHDLYYQGGEISSWNKGSFSSFGGLFLHRFSCGKTDLALDFFALQFCFTGGRLETSVRLPGRPDVYGLWPAVWTMGNLGRVGYGGTLEGTWPYTYDSCDAGTMPNQTLPDGTPTSVVTGNTWGEPLSYLTGQRLSACTCPDDDTHPGPKKADGSWTGRSAPEIDMIEAQVDHTLLQGQVSQSCQFAPFNLGYHWDNATNSIFYDKNISYLNSYSGGQYQMSASGLTTTNQTCYQYAVGGGTHTGCFAVFAYEYQTGSDGYITWFSDDKPSWTYKTKGMHAVSAIDVGDRPIPEEPMYIIMDLAISTAFTTIDYDGLADLFPVHMDVDYVRVYQDADKKNIGCDPDDYPTAAYIDRYKGLYYDYNITTWDEGTDSAPKPKNRLSDTC